MMKFASVLMLCSGLANLKERTIDLWEIPEASGNMELKVDAYKVEYPQRFNDFLYSLLIAELAKTDNPESLFLSYVAVRSCWGRNAKISRKAARLLLIDLKNAGFLRFGNRGVYLLQRTADKRTQGVEA